MNRTNENRELSLRAVVNTKLKKGSMWLVVMAVRMNGEVQSQTRSINHQTWQKDVCVGVL
jgi:hypothetical protein